jgi:hypothetical protein
MWVPASDSTEAEPKWEINKKAVNQFRNFIHAIIQDDIDLIQTWPEFTNWNDEKALWYLTKGTLESFTAEFLEEYQLPIWFDKAPLMKKTRDLLTKLMTVNLSRSFPTADETTIAFVGFGSGDRFPKTVSLACRGIMHGRLIFRGGGKWQKPKAEAQNWDFVPQEISAEHPSVLDTFAQASAIQGFLHGISPNGQQKVEQSFRRHFTEFLQTNSDFSETEVTQHSNNFWVNMKEDISQIEFSRMPQGFEQSVASMSLQNMKQVAESLVSIQALSSFGASGPMTVGGKIETLTIDRVYGLRWWDRLDIPQ